MSDGIDLNLAPQSRPLHVRVAEALGCKPYRYGADVWCCLCGHGSASTHGRPEFTEYGVPSEGHWYEVHHYDTSWSATGPLIEKYSIEMRVRYRAGEPCGWCASNDYGYDYDCEHEGRGPTPLIAVCNLILALKEAGKL